MNAKKQKATPAGKQEASLLLRVEQVKLRKAGPGKSPQGSLCVWEDRVEWTSEVDPADQLLVHFSKIKGQRISPPNKPKVQLQLCMLNDDQATFVFMNSAHSQEQLLQDRDLVKETLQQALVSHRQRVNQLLQKAARGDKEQEAKIKILEQNAHLHDLYLHLVKEKLISAQDFWSFHFKTDEKQSSDEIGDDKRVGISGGFLSSIVQSGGIGGGIRLNLTNETIQSIFRTYPAVERKHLELVPHEMSEQDFWSRFFQSHYFHRERNPAEPSTSAQSQQNDPFADCVQMDEKDMREIVEKGQRSLKRNLDLTYINEDLGILSEMRSAQFSLRGSTEAKRLLVRRCNYHSERVLSTMDEATEGEGVLLAGKKASGTASMGAIENGISTGPNKNGISTNGTSKNTPVPSSATATEAAFDLELESQELADMDKPREQYTHLSAYNPPQQADQRLSPEQIEQAKHTLEEALSSMGSVLEEKNQIDFFNTLTTNYIDDQPASSDQQPDPAIVAAINFTGLNRVDIERIRTVHACLAELLRHFWHCFPPASPEMEQKICRMDETLSKFEQKQLAECEQRYGSIYVEHCREMLTLARRRFQAFKAAQQKRR